MTFLSSLAERAGATGTRIGFPEVHEPRTLEAMRRLLGSGVRPVAVAAGDAAAGASAHGLEVLDASTSDVRAATRPYLEAAGQSDDPGSLSMSVALLRAGRLDGVVAGAEAATADVLRAGLRLLGVKEGIRTVSSAFYMVLGQAEQEDERVLTFTDGAVVPDPTAEQLAEIAVAASDARRAIVGDEPRVAFLSYSTAGSAEGPSVTKARAAVELFRTIRPDVVADGELQVDAALDRSVAARKSPGSPLHGAANVLVFPNLDAANIGYKLVERLGNARAVGPILQGLDGALNDLSRGASIDDIVRVSYVTALMAGSAQEQT
ncbi:MAG: phosphate acyltransferase [Gemmatimonadota bacterium]